MTEGKKNFRLRYVGERLGGARLPVDVLPDLPAFRDLLVSFIKSQGAAATLSGSGFPQVSIKILQSTWLLLRKVALGLGQFRRQIAATAV